MTCLFCFSSNECKTWCQSWKNRFPLFGPFVSILGRSICYSHFCIGYHTIQFRWIRHLHLRNMKLQLILEEPCFSFFCCDSFQGWNIDYLITCEHSYRFKRHLPAILVVLAYLENGKNATFDLPSKKMDCTICLIIWYSMYFDILYQLIKSYMKY